ncbi:MAG: hypothetical protein JWQ43_3462, partial [Glaciihabitans sp.]|nr:hypothetical protein [Glaciihabitans sp.]
FTGSTSPVCPGFSRPREFVSTRQYARQMDNAHQPAAVAATADGGPADTSDAARSGSATAPGRISGLDIARGLAVIGMFAAHVLILEPFTWGDPHTWGDIVSGRSSILFATLAGISIAIISGGVRRISGVPLLQARLRILVRAVLVFVLGGLLTGLGTPVYIILEYYAVLFVLALPFLRWRPRSLFIAAGALSVLSPILQLVGTRAWDATGFADSFIVELFLTGHYPAITWLVFVLIGLGVGRLDLNATAVRLRILAAGVSLAIVGYGLGSLSAALFPAPQSSAPAGRATELDWSQLSNLAALSTVEPHSGSPFEVIGSAGFALAVIGICLVLGSALRKALFPLAAIGSMALTAYSVQLLALAFIGNSYWVQGADNGGLFIVLTVAITLGCTAWALVIGKGPLEQVLTQISRRASHVSDGEPAAGPGQGERVASAERPGGRR